MGKIDSSNIYLKLSLSWKNFLLTPQLDNFSDENEYASTLYGVGCNYARKHNYDSAIAFLTEAYKIAQHEYDNDYIPSYYTLTYTLWNLSSCYSNLSHIDSAVVIEKKGIYLLHQMLDYHFSYALEENLANIEANLAQDYFKLDQYDSSIFYSENSIEIRKKLIDYDNKIYHFDFLQTYLDLSKSFYEVGELDSALKYANLVASSADRTLRIRALLVLGEIYFNNNNDPEAYHYFTRAIQVTAPQKDSNNYKLEVANAYQYIGQIVIVDFPIDSKNYFIKSLKLLDAYDTSSMEAKKIKVEVYTNLSYIYINSNSLDSAKFFIDKSSEVLNNIPNDSIFFIKRLANIYMVNGIIDHNLKNDQKSLAEYQKAYDYFNNLPAVYKEQLRDTINELKLKLNKH